MNKEYIKKNTLMFFILIILLVTINSVSDLKLVQADTKIDKPYAIEGALKRGEQLVANISIEKLESYKDNAYLVFELFDGNTPILINAVSIDDAQKEITQYFNVEGSN